MIEHYLFESKEVGPRLLVFGAIHGDEICGPKAIHHIMHKLKSGKLTLSRGSVRFVPVCNPEAYTRRQRYIEENLNRVFRKTKEPKSYEARLANELCLLMDEANVFLDIHSTRTSGETNAFVDYPTEANIAFAEALNVSCLILDWPAIYEGDGKQFGAYPTNWYAHECGMVETIIECGQHNDPKAARVAEEAILRTLLHFDMVSGVRVPKSLRCPHRIRMTKLFVHEREGDRLTKEWRHLENVPAGSCVAERASGERICVEKDSVIILPKPNARQGEEWFYLGEVE
jgi:predicted deacylase